MADQIPIKVMCDGSGNTCGLAQFTSSDSLAVSVGGTGLTTQGICAYTQPGLYVVGCQVTYLGICAGKADTGAGHDNTYIGHSAGTAVTTGCQHTLIGSQAGKAITTCSGTTAVGYNAGCKITFGMMNTLIGYSAGNNITTADCNTGLGYLALSATICDNNVAIGTCAMTANTQGQNNVAVGHLAGKTQVAAGCNNTFIGACAAAVALCSENTIVGASAGVAQTSGVKNVFLGACVGYGVQGGSNNVYLGHHAGLVNTSGNANVFIGNCAGAASTASCCLIIGNATCDLILGNFNNGIVSMNCVGIGTAAPATPLHINTTGAGPTALTISNSNADAGAAYLKFTKSSASPADNDYAGHIDFYVENDNDQETRSALIFSQMTDVSDGTEDGNLVFKTMKGGTDTEALAIAQSAYHGTGVQIGGRCDFCNSYWANHDYWIQVNGGTSYSGAVITSVDASADNTNAGAYMFQNRNNSDAALGTSTIISGMTSVTETTDSNAGDDSGGHLQFWTKPEAGNIGERIRISSAGLVGIGTTAPDGPLHVYTASAGVTAAAAADELILENSAAAGMSILSGNTSTGSIFFGDDGSNQIGRIQYNHNVNCMIFSTNASENMVIDSSGIVGIGNTSPTCGPLNIYTASMSKPGGGWGGGIVLNSCTEVMGHTTIYSCDACMFLGFHTNGHIGIYEGANNASQLTVCCTGIIGVANGSPSTVACINSSTKAIAIGQPGCDGNVNLTMATCTNGNGRIAWTDTADNTHQAMIRYDHNNANMHFCTIQSGGLFKFSSDTGNDLMTIGDASSNARVGIGTMSPVVTLEVEGTAASPTSANGAAGIVYIVGAASDSGIALGSYTASPWRNWIQSQQENGTVSDLIVQPRAGKFSINNATPGGQLHVSNTTSAIRAFTVDTNQVNEFVSSITQNAASFGSGTGYPVLQLQTSNSGSGLTDYYFLNMHDSGSNKAWIRGDGTYGSATNSYGSTSDVRLKSNIADTTNKLDDVNKLRVVNFTKDDYPELKQIGLIAQEVQSVFPSMVDENLYHLIDNTGKPDESGTPSLNVKYSILVPILVKAIQELTAKVSALEAA